MKRNWENGLASEQKVLDELKRRGLPCQHRVQIDFYEVDILVGERMIVEVDGYVHLTKTSIEKDQRKDEYLREQGFVVLRITGNQVRNRGDLREFGRRVWELYQKEQRLRDIERPKPLQQTIRSPALEALREQLNGNTRKASQKKVLPRSLAKHKSHRPVRLSRFFNWVQWGKAPRKD